MHVVRCVVGSGTAVEELPMEPLTATELLRLMLKMASYCSKSGLMIAPEHDVLGPFVRKKTSLLQRMENVGLVFFHSRSVCADH